MRIILIVFIIGFYSTTTSGQSVNAYYDAIRLSQIGEAKDTAESHMILSILAGYSRTNNYHTPEITEMYIQAVKNLFSLDALSAWFEGINGNTAETKELGKKVKNYTSLKTRATVLDNTIRMFNDRYESIRLQLSDSNTLKEPVTRKNAYDTLRDYFIQFSDLKRRSDTIRSADSAARILQNPSTALAILENNVYRQNILYTEESEKLNKELSRLPLEIQNYFVKYFSRLDTDLQENFSKKINTNGKRTPDLNIAIPQANAQANNLSDELYRKNETASLTNFKLPSQTEMIDALAIYLAKRFKQEVALTLVDQFRKTLKNDRLLNDLFPETYKMFKSGELFEMPSFGSAWNYAISKDFTGMLTNLSTSAVVKEKIGDSILVNYLQNIIKLSTLINRQYSYVDAVSQLFYQDQSANFFTKSIRSLHIINKELFDTARASQFWINAEGLYALTDSQLDIFYALLKEKYNNDLGIINANDLANPVMQPRIRNMMSSMLVLLNNFQSNRRNMMTVQGSKVQVSGYWDFLMSLFETLQTQGTIQPSPYVQKFVMITNLCFETYAMLSEKNYTGAALKLVDLLPAIKDQHYVDLEAICFSANKLQKVIASSSYTNYKPVQEKMDRLDKLIKSYLFTRDLKKELLLHTADYRYLLTDPRILQLEQKNPKLKLGSFRNNLLSQLEKDSSSLQREIISTSAELKSEIAKRKFGSMEIIPVSDITKLILAGAPETNKYISQSGATQFETIRKITGFLSDMVLAGNSRNLSQVIEKYALPPNSYKIKRHTRSSWDINAYVGAYAGAERLSDSSHSVSPVYGFSVPVGVSYSWGKTKSAKNSDEPMFHTRKGERVLKGNSITINLSLIDIGAVVSYRLTNDASKGLPQQVKWSQLISPGLHVRWGIRETPICFSAGIQSTPQLRKLNDTSPPVSAVRLYAGFFFDIPLFNISYR